MKKILIIASVYGFIETFEISNISILLDKGYEVHIAANNRDTITQKRFEPNKLKNKSDVKIHFYDIQRSPLSLKNIEVFFEIKKLICTENIRLIHCHTPIGGVLGRILGKVSNAKVIYTAHGFHFFKGASFINWMLYYPIEKFLSKYTDTLITINREDYRRAQNFLSKKIEYIPGVGIETRKNKKVNIACEEKRKEFSLKKDEVLLLSVGELNSNKNHEVVLRALSQKKNPKIKYFICGEGVLKSYLSNLIEELRLGDSVRLLGFRNDVIEIMKIADIFIHSSKREGLPVSLMEAMSVGLPVICSDIRGNMDLVENNRNGFLVDNNSEEYSEKIDILLNDAEIRREMSVYGKEKILEFSVEQVEKRMKKVYEGTGE